MTGKHTPGPWHCRGFPTISAGKGNGMVAKVLERYMDRAEREANARLIAKAPELHALALRIARLNRDAGEIGAGMLASLVDEARRLADES